jgi:hypothetical protein
MGRSTFEGPLLAGNNRFGQFRNVGNCELSQDANIVLTNTTSGTQGYSGGSGQFIQTNLVYNFPGTVYVPGAQGTLPSYNAPAPTPAVIPADTATQIYRGVVFYVPANSNINDLFADIGTAVSVAAGTITSVTVLVGNGFNSSQYGTFTTSGTGRQTCTYTGANILAMQATTPDLYIQPATSQGTSPLASVLSQVVFTISIVGTGMTTLTGGGIYTTVRYTQYDDALGNSSANYPYGNLD